MVNRFIKLLSMFLAVVLLVNMLPLGIMAQDLQNSLSANTTVTENVEEADVANAEIVTEIPEKRTEYSKEFLLSDGMRLATIYPAPVHYQTDEGWVDIDNTLVTKADGTYTNADAPWSVSFPKELTNENKVTVDVDGYSLSFVMEGQVHKANPLLRSSEPRLKVASKAPATVKQPGAVLKEMKLEEDKTVPQKLYSQLTYADVFENTDVIYDLESNAVKESIVLQQYDETLEGYRYTLYTGNLVPVMDATGHIDLYADGVGEPVISLPSPYLLDDVGEYCDEVKVTLTGGDGVYTMTYSLPQQWLAAEERAWPVILDPIVKANTSASNIQDRTFCENDIISYKKSVFYAGYDPELGIIRGYLKYNDLPILNSSDVIVKAEFSLNKVMDSSSSGVVEVHKITSEWTSKDNDEWKDRPSYDQNISDYKNVKTEGWYTWNVTDIVRDWYATENNGLMIKMPDSVEKGSTKRFRQFYSSDTGATSKRPKLKITIRNNNGLEGYWDYTSTSAGRAGTGHVNKFTGNLTWVREDMGFAGCIMPVSISHVYNLNDSTAIDTGNNSNQTAGNYFGMGSGWRINYSERVYQWSTDSKYYIWEDEDGTDHYFKEKTSNNYIDEDNPDLTLTRTKKNGKITKYQIKDKKGNLRIFDESGRLTTLQNNRKGDYISKISISYDGDTQRIKTILDSANRLYHFTYKCGLLTKISYYGTDTNRTEDPLREINYAYDRCICTDCADCNAAQQECCDNCVTEASGDEHVNLISISEYFGENDPNNYTCTFEYKEDVLSYTESGTADNDTPSTDSSDDDVEDSEDAPGTPGDDDTPDDVEPEETTPTESTEPTDSTEPAETPESSEDTEIPEETEPSENTEPVEPAQTTEPTEGSGDTDSTTDASLNRYLSVLTGVNDYTGYRLDYEYYKPTAAWRPYRVKTITESYPKTGIDNDGAPENDQTAPETPADANEEQPSAGDDQQSEDALRKQGGSIQITYGNNETTFVDHWGKKEVYQFNDFGNTICIQDDQGRAQFSQFAFSTIKQKETNTDATKKTNQMTLSSDLQYSVVNLMIHNGTPTPDQWQAFGEDATCTKDTAKGSVDKNSLKVQQSSTTTEAGAFGVTYKTSFVIKPGEAQTFSCDLIAGTPVFLRAQSTLKTVESEPLEVGTAWYRQQVTYTNDSNQDVTVTYSAVAEPGAAFYLDCPQLENAHSASRYNLVNDGDFSTEDIWTKKNCTDADKFVSLSQLQNEPNDESLEAPPIPQANDRFVVITGDTAKEKSVTQTIEIAGKKGDSLTFGGWAKGDSVPLTTSNSKTRKFAIECTIVYKDTSKSNSTFTAAFNPDSNEWQYTAGSAVAKYDYKQIKMSAVYNYNANTAMFDGIQLYKDAFGSTFKYDKNGNVVSVTDSDKKETKYSYDENDDLISEILPTGTKLTYDYDEYHKPTKATTDEGLVYTYKYDDWGNNIQVSISDGTNAVTSKVDYTDDGNLIDNTTDAMGKVTHYGYNEETGILEWVQKPGETEDTRTNYTYDSLFRMTQASVGEFVETDPGIFAQYAYENELLAGITTQTVEYGFAYNDLSLRTSALVDGQEIVGYTYYGDEDCPDNSALAQKLAIDGALYSIDYANGDMVVYTYDDLGRLIQETYTRKNPGENDQVETVTYAYDNAGSLASVTDSSTGITSKTLYDTVDRLVRYTETGGSHDLLVRYRYDSENRVKYILYMVDNNLSKKAHNAQYTYDDDNRIDTYRKGNGVLDYTYDKLNRTGSTKLTHKGNDIITTQYAFVSPGTKQTSTQVSTVTRTVSGVESTDHYKYDDRGNIEEVWHNGDETKKITYSYDTLNQLIREDNPFAQYTHIWEYDGAGNILSRTEYPYTAPDAQLPEPTKTVSYVYLGNLGDVENGDEISTDNAWADTLLSYDGQPITYDEMGNPLDDGIREYTWKNGRELASIEKDNKTWTFAYNADGLRTKRTNGTLTYDYVYYGDQLMYMSVDGYDFILSYTPEGVPMGITFKGTAYYYETNLQGDVIGILNHDGERLISYSYDAWGNPLTPTFYITGLQQFQLAPLFDYNPLRYRGYVYDTETGLYYVGSRYYNPETGRFINADNIDLLGANGDFASLNLYAYCGNNPVSRADHGGQFWNTIIGAVAGAVVGGISAAIMGEDITAGIVSGAISGAISGAAVDITIATGGAGLVALAGVAAASGVGGAAGSYVNQRMQGVARRDIDWGVVVIDGIWGAIGGALSFGAADIGGKTCKTLAENLAQKGTDKLVQAASDFATATTIAAGTWLNGTKMKTLYKRLG